MSWAGHGAIRGLEVAPYGIDYIPGPRAILLIAMSKRGWNLLDEDLKQVVRDINGKFMDDRMMAHYLLEDEDLMEEYVKEHGGQLYTLTPDEWAAWSEVIAPATEDWLAEQEARGFAVRAVYKGFQTYLNAWRKLREESK